MWIAERQIISPRTDEDAAMGYQKSDRYTTKEDAYWALVRMVIEEIQGWRRMNMSYGREQRALVQIANEEIDEFDKIEVDGVRWQVREF